MSTYCQFVVDIIGAALFMPQKAPYLLLKLLPVAHKSEYGFAMIVISTTGRLVADNVLRDRITYCTSTSTKR